MPEDRPEDNTLEEGTSYRFGPADAPPASTDGTAREPHSTAGIVDDTSGIASPTGARTQGRSSDFATRRSPPSAAPETAGPSGSGLNFTRMNSPRPGDLLFGRYRVERLLGRGGMGEVWLVRHEILHDQLALKLIIPGAAIDDELLRRFAREAQVMRALSKHPHAVVVHDADIDVDRQLIYIVMDVIHGASIEKLLKPGVPMPLDWTTEVLGQLCDVLQQAHDRGIVHRDLSPANLMLEDQPDNRAHLRVLDFGIAKVLGPESEDTESAPLTEDGQFFGKRSYASPEQLNGARVDARSDLYSIGVILYEFLTGYRPFTGGPAKLMHDHCATEPPWFAEINPDVQLPEPVEQVVRRYLAKNPADRPQSALELYELFRAAALGTQAKVSPEHRPAPASRVAPVAVQVRPRPPAKGISWTVRALIAVSLIAGCAALVFSIPRPAPAPMPVTIPGPVLAWLAEHDLRPIPGSGVAAGGFPRGVEGGADRRRLAWHDGIYIPEAYEPDPEQGRSGLLPRALKGKDGARFLLIEGGDFVMGAFDDRIKDFYSEEKPGHRVGLSSFYIQQTETTFGAFESFCKETARDRNDPDIKDGFYYAWDALRMKMNEDEVRKHPAVGVSRKLAEAYARHFGGDLPSEAQWEFTARSRGKNQLYVWGNRQDFPSLVNIKKPVVVGIETLPVGLSTDDRTEQGVLDLAGNVREWTRDVWKVYPQVESMHDPVQEPAGDDANPLYAIRGGSYETDRETARTTWRADVAGKAYRGKKDDYEFDLGFRIVLKIIEVPPSLMPNPHLPTAAARERAP